MCSNSRKHIREGIYNVSKELKKCLCCRSWCSPRIGNVISAPTGAPQNVRVSSVTQTRADLLWNEPDCELRNGKITEYDYQLDSLDEWDENRTDHSTGRRVLFDRLIPFTRYRARVRANNVKGEGPYSDWTTFQTLPACK